MLAEMTSGTTLRGVEAPPGWRRPLCHRPGGLGSSGCETWQHSGGWAREARRRASPADAGGHGPGSALGQRMV